MNASLILLPATVLEGVIMMALPFFSPRPIYFGVHTGVEFREAPFGQKVRVQYWSQVAVWTLLSVAILLAAGGSGETAPAVAGMLPVALSLVAFLRAYFQVRPHALRTPVVREAELSDGRRFPRWLWLAAPPFALPLAAMIYLKAHWQQIPARFPVHFNAVGEADRWADKSERTVFALLWYSEGMLLLFLLLLFAVLIGSRKSVRRTALPGIFVAAMYMLAVMFPALALMPLVPVPPAAMIGLALAYVTAALVYGYRRNADPRATVESTPDECWTLGSFYRNANDPAIFVQRRIGLGYTVNLGNVWTYVVLGGFILGMAALTLLFRA